MLRGPGSVMCWPRVQTADLGAVTDLADGVLERALGVPSSGEGYPKEAS